MKYKLIKEYPGSPEVGTVCECQTIPGAGCALIGTQVMLYGIEPNKHSEYWAKYKFTTDDDIDIFKEDKTWLVDDKLNLWGYDDWEGDDEDYKYFSTEEAVKKYIDSLKPQFEEGVWYHRNRCDALYIGDGKGVGFVDGMSERWRDDLNMSNPKWWTKSDLKEVEKLLIHKAKEDYPEGTRFETAKLFYGFPKSVVGEIHDNELDDGIVLYSNNAIIYYSGKWANIIEKPIIKTDDGKFWYPSDFVEGKVIHVSYSNIYSSHNWIIECNGNERNRIRSTASVSFSSENFYSNDEFWGTLESDYKIREATPEEKELLQKCKYAGKFVKDDELVMVVDWEYCYSCHKTLAKELKLQNWEYAEEPENNKVYRAVKEFYHIEECTVIEDLTTKQTFIVGNQGLQPIKKV